MNEDVHPTICSSGEAGMSIWWQFPPGMPPFVNEEADAQSRMCHRFHLIHLVKA